MSNTQNIEPTFIMPAKSCDAHCHVFGPEHLFPYSKSRKYTPEDAPKEKLFSLHKQLGIERAVLVQASCHGTDNSAMVDMLANAKGSYRGIAIIDESFTQNDLLDLHKVGVRGIRFNFLTRLVDTKPLEHYLRLAAHIADLGWHIVVYFESENLVGITDLLNDIPCPIIIDHMGRPDVSLNTDSTNFQRICKLLKNKNNAIKISGIERLSNQGAPYCDAIIFGKYLVDHFPDQVLWGTDWPHPNMEDNMPSDILLVNSIPLMATNKIAQQKLLIDNPHRIYGFDNK